MSNNFWKSKKAEREDNDPFVSVRVYLPRSTYKLLEEKRLKELKPISRLVAYAVDNELDSKLPFNYPCDLAETDFVEYQYADAAARMATYLERFSSGVSLDSLMLLRRDMQIESRAELLGAYRELLTMGIIEEVRGRNFAYGPEHFVARLVGLPKKQLIKKRYRSVEGGRNPVITDDMIERDEDNE